MEKKSWIISLFATMVMIILVVGVTSAGAVDNVQIADILNNPEVYEDIEVEIVGTIVEIDYGLLLEDSTGAQLLVSTGPMWYLNSDTNGLNLEVGEIITVKGVVCTVPGPNEQNSIHLAALEVNGILLREAVGESPNWSGSHGRGHRNGQDQEQSQGHCGASQRNGQSQNQGRNWSRSEVAAGLCGGGSVSGLVGYGLRRM